MKVVNPDLSTNSIALIPRFDTLTEINVTLVNKPTNEETLFNIINFDYSDGLLEFDLTFDFNEDYKYNLIIKNESDVVLYKGLIIATNQNIQNYDNTEDLYIYG